MSEGGGGGGGGGGGVLEAGGGAGGRRLSCSWRAVSRAPEALRAGAPSAPPASQQVGSCVSIITSNAP